MHLIASSVLDQIKSMEIDQDYPESIDLIDALSINTVGKCCNSKDSSESNLSKASIETSDSVMFTESSIIYREELERIGTFLKPALSELENKFVFLGPRVQKYTLILDLDNTLVYASMGKTKAFCAALSLNVTIRPFSLELFEQLSALYEIVIFTAASYDYAHAVVSILDPERKYIKKVVSREHCVEISGGYVVKDLRIFKDRNINEMVIVDDSIYSFAFNIGNGIPISRFEDDDEDDHELVILAQYLRKLYECDGGLLNVNKSQLWGALLDNH